MNSKAEFTSSSSPRAEYGVQGLYLNQTHTSIRTMNYKSKEELYNANLVAGIYTELNLEYQ